LRTIATGIAGGLASNVAVGLSCCQRGGYGLPVSNERDRLLLLYRERVAGYADVSDDFRDRWLAWCRAVLAHGGDLVVPPLHPEPDLDRLLAAGALQGPRVRALELGGDCHANVARLWIDGGVDAAGTGYALHDGLWRQHSWGVDHDGTVLETKSLCERYVGLTLPPGEPTVRFALSNHEDDIRKVLKDGTGRANEIIRVLRAVRNRRAESERRDEPQDAR
jgi:hypothetical protein